MAKVNYMNLISVSCRVWCNYETSVSQGLRQIPSWFCNEIETALSGQLGWATQSPWTILVYSQTTPTPCGWGAGGGGRLGPGTANHCLELSLRDIFGLWPELRSGSLLLETQWAPFTPNPQWAVLIARLSDEDITKSMKIWEISSSEGRNTQ